MYKAIETMMLKPYLTLTLGLYPNGRPETILSGS